MREALEAFYSRPGWAIILDLPCLIATAIGFVLFLCEFNAGFTLAKTAWSVGLMIVPFVLFWGTCWLVNKLVGDKEESD